MIDFSEENTAASSPWTFDLWKPYLLGFWLAGSVVWMVVTVTQSIRFSRLVGMASAASEALRVQADRISERLGLSRVPEIRIVDGRLAPMLWVMGIHPVIVLPIRLLEGLSEREQESVLTHEFVHLARRDHWMRRFEVLVLGLFWWHPVVWWCVRELRQAEERCCDARVVELFPHHAREYATTLLKAVDFLSGVRPALPLGASGFGQANLLKRRIEMILDSRNSHRLSWPLRIAVLSLGLGILGISPLAIQADDAEMAQTIMIEIKKDGSVHLRVGKPDKIVSGSKDAMTEKPELEVSNLETGEVRFYPMVGPAVIHKDKATGETRLVRVNRKLSSTQSDENTKLDEEIERELSKTVSLRFKNAPLKKVFRAIAGIISINVVFDNLVLEGERVTSNTPISIDVDGIKLKSALNLILRPLNLVYVIEDEVLKITSPERAGMEKTRSTESSRQGQDFVNKIKVKEDLLSQEIDKTLSGHSPKDLWDGETITEKYLLVDAESDKTEIGLKIQKIDGRITIEMLSSFRLEKSDASRYAKFKFIKPNSVIRIVHKDGYSELTETPYRDLSELLRSFSSTEKRSQGEAYRNKESSRITKDLRQHTSENERKQGSRDFMDFDPIQGFQWKSGYIESLRKRLKEISTFKERIRRQQQFTKPGDHAQQLYRKLIQQESQLKKEPPHQNLWVNSGSGRRPRLW